MSTILFPSPIFGPVLSRRLGTSLGVNLLPASGKVCTFDCIYCECGLNNQVKTHDKMPSRELVCEELKRTLQAMKQRGDRLDIITFAGNGEPTAHPKFAEIINDTIELRDRYYPDTKIGVLTNGTQIHKPKIFEALKKIEDNIQKLDTVDESYIKRIDRPVSHFSVAEQIERLKAFDGKLKIQTMFMGGKDADGVDVDNTSEEFIQPWLDVVKAIRPQEVMIYTLDRETPLHQLKKTAPEVLDRIAERLRQAGLKVIVGY